MRSVWLGRLGMLVFTAVLLYPLIGLLAPVGHWRWDGSIPGSTFGGKDLAIPHWDRSAYRYLDRYAGGVVSGAPPGRDRIVWEAAVLISVLMPPLALGNFTFAGFWSADGIGWLASADRLANQQ